MTFPKLPNGMITGRLLQAERELIAETLHNKGAPKSCECCGQSDWTLGEYIISPFSIARQTTHFRPAPSDPYFPSVLMFCKNCGNTKQFNLVILGLGDKIFPKEPEVEE